MIDSFLKSLVYMGVCSKKERLGNYYLYLYWGYLIVLSEFIKIMLE